MQSSKVPTQPATAPGYTAQPSTATSTRMTNQTSPSSADGQTQKLTLSKPECTKGSRCNFSDWLGKQEIYAKPLGDGKMWFGLVPSFKYNGFHDSAASALNRDTILSHASHIDTKSRYDKKQIVWMDQFDLLSSILSEHQNKCMQDRTCWMDPSTFITSGLSGDALTFVARRASDCLSEEIGDICGLRNGLITTSNSLYGAKTDLDSKSQRALGFRWYHNQGPVREETVRDRRDRLASKATDLGKQLAHRVYLLDKVQTFTNGTEPYESSLTRAAEERMWIITEGGGQCVGRTVEATRARG